MRNQLKSDIIIIVVLFIVVCFVFLYPSFRDFSFSNGSEQGFNELIVAVSKTWLFDGTEFPHFDYRDAVSNDRLSFSPKGMTVVVVLGKTGCNPCQLRELRNVDSLFSKLGGLVPALALYYDDINRDEDDHRYNALQLRRVGGISYPIGYTSDIRFADYISSGRFPMVFLLNGSNVVISLAAMPLNNEYSYAFYQNLYHKISDLALFSDNQSSHDIGSLSEVEMKWTFHSLSGDETCLSEFSQEVIILHFWATWCMPCLKELPLLQEFYDEVKGEEVDILIVSNENDDVIREYIETLSIDIPTYYHLHDPPDKLSYESIPTTYIISKSTLNVLKHVGAINWGNDRAKEFITQDIFSRK